MTEESKDREIVEAFFPDRRESEDADGFTVIEQMDNRSVDIMVPTDGQLTQMMRGITAMERAGNGVQAIKPMVAVLDILMLLIAKKTDRDWLNDQMDRGLINVADWEPAIRSMVGDTEPVAPRNGPPVKRARAQR